MFTGIVQGTAKLVSLNKKQSYSTYCVTLPVHMLGGLELGASIAYNGCCLTVTKISDDCVSVDLINETLRVTNLGELVAGDQINVERAAKFNDEIGGHLMSGHIITTAKIAKIIISKNKFLIWFEVKNPLIMKYILHKGFIAVDGISLTVGEIKMTYFCVHLIPETLQRTTLGTKKLGRRVNLEINSQTQAIVDTVELLLKNQCMEPDGTIKKLLLMNDS